MLLPLKSDGPDATLTVIQNCLLSQPPFGRVKQPPKKRVRVRRKPEHLQHKRGPKPGWKVKKREEEERHRLAGEEEEEEDYDEGYDEVRTTMKTMMKTMIIWKANKWILIRITHSSKRTTFPTKPEPPLQSRSDQRKHRCGILLCRLPIS
jgi:hypothetical protein